MKTLPTRNLALFTFSIAGFALLVGCGSGRAVTGSGYTVPTSPTEPSVTPVPTAVAFNATSNTYYVPTGEAGTLAVYDSSTNSSKTEISVFPDHLLDQVAINPNTNMIYTTASDASALFVIDGATNSVVGDIGADRGIGKIAVNPTTNLIYTISSAPFTVNGTSTLSVFDGATKKETASIALNDYANGIAINTSTNLLYVTTYTGILVIDGSTNKVIASVPSTQTDLVGSFDVALDENSNTVFVSNAKITYSTPVADTVSFIDVGTNTVTSTISVGMGMGQGKIAVNPTTKVVYVLNTSSNTLTVISEASASVVATIDLPSQATGLTTDASTVGSISVNTSKNLVYLVVAQALITVDGATNTIVTN